MRRNLFRRQQRLVGALGWRFTGTGAIDVESKASERFLGKQRIL